ncbi:MAG TPA: hypothetical protein VF765_01185 [Polyangiaceae bacterium]
MNVSPLVLAAALLTTLQSLPERPSAPHGSRTGTLVVRWTFGGRATPDACDSVRAATVEIDIHDASSSEVASLVAPCAAFAATAALPEGSYAILAVAEDDHGRPVSVPMHDRVAIEAGASRTVAFNFPFWAVAGHAPGEQRPSRP